MNAERIIVTYLYLTAGVAIALAAWCFVLADAIDELLVEPPSEPFRLKLVE